MLTSAMFYQLAGNSKYVMRIGSMVIDYKGIIIGVQSSLIVLPVNIALEFLFRNSERGQEKKLKKLPRHGTYHMVRSDKEAKRTKLLCSRWVYVAWMFSITASLTSIIVIIMYSMQWGDKKSKQWILSSVTGFFQSAFIIQPLKLVIMAVILAAIFKKNNEDSAVIDSYKDAPQRTSKQECNVGKDCEQLLNARSKRYVLLVLYLENIFHSQIEYELTHGLFSSYPNGPRRYLVY